eukprot:2335047-Rhodomonas_salina.3
MSSEIRVCRAWQKTGKRRNRKGGRPCLVPSSGMVLGLEYSMPGAELAYLDMTGRCPFGKLCLFYCPPRDGPLLLDTIDDVTACS